MHASAQPLVLRSSRAHQRTHSKTRPCTRTHDTHAYTHPAEEAARVAGTGQVDPSCTVPGQASDALEFPEEKKNDLLIEYVKKAVSAAVRLDSLDQ